jgi:hypothetical protein
MILLFEDFKYQDSIEDIIVQLREFLSKPFPRNKWISSDNISIYVRQSKRFINGEHLDFLDLATIDIDPMGEKIFINLLDRIEKEFHMYNIFIESILSDRFLNFFLKRGYTKTAGIDSNNVYRMCIFK